MELSENKDSKNYKCGAIQEASYHAVSLDGQITKEIQPRNIKTLNL